ncbi:hypothetical protein [Methanohalophilus mahii]|uniref:PKD domain containing protein n=1 Tax=Methanohalophilus mahii (strain ATCC 35705 / DSM 5219 / SLP) TaxID=547558 RepID=D5E8Y1_METMS|nr:hypothetical protein [Methanohalophilus mahii]ADE35640.1 hypothetical protein Mmah_0104 [Methanohalophilus mahii DSM 5219]
MQMIFNREGVLRAARLLLLTSFILIFLTPSFSLASDDTYFSGDNITVDLEIDANQETPAQLQLMIYNPHNKLVGNATHEFGLEKGENLVNYTMPFVTDTEGLHYLRYDIFADLDGGWTLVQSSTQYFDGQINDPPLIEIISPTEDGVYALDEDILFSANVSDPESHSFSVAWRSNVSGIIGNGTSLYASLAEGMHLINVTAEDERGAASNRSILIQVVESADDQEDGVTAGTGGGGTGSATIVTDTSLEDDTAAAGDGDATVSPGDREQTDVPDGDTDETPVGPEQEEESSFLPGFGAVFVVIGLLLAARFKRK